MTDTETARERQRLADLDATDGRRVEIPTPPAAFKQYRSRQITEMRPVTDAEIILGAEGCILAGILIWAVDIRAGSPKHGDMVARDEGSYLSQRLVPAKQFADNYEPI